LGIKGPKKKENSKQLNFCYAKFLEYGFPKDGVESICDVHLEHHPIIMDVQCNLNTMNHHFAPMLNCCVTKLMKQQINQENVTKLQT
jgi:hypothetical protein